LSACKSVLYFYPKINKIRGMKGAGFTLIELLVIIAIITLSMAILLPVLHKSRGQSYAIVCGSNLKQLSQALYAYEQENDVFPHGFDHHNRITPPGGYVGDAVYGEKGWWWFHFLGDDIRGDVFKGKTILRCPARKVKDPGLRENVLCGNYGVNRSICKDNRSAGSNEFIGAPLGPYQIRRPEETLILVDSGYSLISWKAATNADVDELYENKSREGAFYVPGMAINQERTFSSAFAQDALNGRHPGKSINAGFADGHVSRLKADELFVEKTGDDYKNLSPLWAP
jgi:prepilin-type processing-associated H-X9-DG protein